MFKMIHTIVCDEKSVEMVAHDVVCEFDEDGVAYLELRSTSKSQSSHRNDKTILHRGSSFRNRQGYDECTTMRHVRLLLSIDRGHSVTEAHDHSVRPLSELELLELISVVILLQGTLLL